MGVCPSSSPQIPPSVEHQRKTTVLSLENLIALQIIAGTACHKCVELEFIHCLELKDDLVCFTCAVYHQHRLYFAMFIKFLAAFLVLAMTCGTSLQDLSSIQCQDCHSGNMEWGKGMRCLYQFTCEGCTQQKRCEATAFFKLKCDNKNCRFVDFFTPTGQPLQPDTQYCGGAHERCEECKEDVVDNP
ncbi:hypothetical protein O181_036543 [Austropuccinia psidii MF-1]|uniref:Uncharacterized protein n=1 Tax=Austropuccinia psidii MF-1 TaxID=1389203 RepID=A0A9Q3D9P0_9BASI|nr:hypothetical protein [Austropuccinia psidii MF-1]